MCSKYLKQAIYATCDFALDVETTEVKVVEMVEGGIPDMEEIETEEITGIQIQEFVTTQLKIILNGISFRKLKYLCLDRHTVSLTSFLLF